MTPWTPWLFAWQAWHLVTSTFTLRGRRGTWWHRLSSHTTCHHTTCSNTTQLTLGDIDYYFAWQACHLRHWAGSGGAPGSQMTPWTPRLFAWQAWHLVTSTFTLRGSRGTWWHRLSAWQAWHLVTSTIYHFAWKACHLRHWAGSGGAPGFQMTPWDRRWLFGWQAWHLATSTVTLRGKGGAWWHRCSLCDAGVALTALGRLWWRTRFPNDAMDAAALCVAGVALPTLTFILVACVALGDIDFQRGRRGTWWHRLSPHTTCHHTTCSHTQLYSTTCHHTTCSNTTQLTLGDIDYYFAWQVCHLRHWAGSGGAPGSPMTPWTPRLFAWQAWHLVTSTFTLRGLRGTWWHRLSAWQARHLVTSTIGVPLTALGRLWWRTGFPNDAVDAAAICVAGVALGDIDRHFAWQAWHLVTSTLTLRCRRGTYGTGPALVANQVPKWRRGRRGSLRGRRGTWWHWLSFWWPAVALGDIAFHFAWRAWHLVTSTITSHNLSSRNLLTHTHTQLAHTQLYSTTCHHTTCSNTTQLTLGDIDYYFAWQACHLRHWAGSGGAPGSQMTPWTPRLFRWQAWHLVTWWHRLSAWHLRHWAGSGGAPVPKWRRGRRGCLRGRRCT